MNEQPINSDLVTAQSTPPVAAPNSQPTTENPLDKLRDIHLPEPIDAFPYAPGWWILLAILLIVAGYFVYRQIKYRRAIRLLIPAKVELDQLKSLSGDLINSQSVAKLSALIKRICLIYFPASQVAALSGAQWLEFLNTQVTQINTKNNQSIEPLFNNKAISLFSQVAYQKNAQVEQSEWLALLTASEKCIELIVKQAARQQLAGKSNKSRGLAWGNQ